MVRGLENYNKAVFESDNYFDFPVITRVRNNISLIPKFLDFDTFRRKKTFQNNGVHFFIDDYKFQCIWNSPERYSSMFQKSELVIMPDFSLYYDFPLALQIYNKYRNHWLANYYSVNGVKVIPNISVSTSDCWEWSFLGYPQKSVLAFCDIGSIRNSTSRDVLCKSYEEMIKRLNPIQILYFTRSKKSAPSECDIIELSYYK